MFIGRTSELQSLENEYRKEGFSFSVIYGRRRVGKTTLIKEFCKDKKFIYYMGLESSLQENLKSCSNAILSVLDPKLKGMSFDNFEQALDRITAYNEHQKLIFVIDEYPYLANCYPTISSLLQRTMDHDWENHQIMVILCGSSMSFMEKQVLGYQSPLYGRRTMQMKVQPFHYLETAECFPERPHEEQAILYSITGGIPDYIARIDPSWSIKETIIQLFLNKDGKLYEEPSNLMKQELRDPSRYNAIVEAIASGATKLSDISSKTKLETSTCANYIENLIGLGIISRERPANEMTSKKTIYKVVDQMFRFWYRFVLPNLSLLELGLYEEVYHQIVEPQLSAYMGYAFEDICAQYLKEEMKRGKLSLYQQMGTWWGTNPNKKRAEEIDIMLVKKDAYLLGECKWWNQAVDDSVLMALFEKGEMFPQKKEYYVFSKSGFTDQAIAYAKEFSITLCSINELYE